MTDTAPARRSREEIFAGLPREWPEPLLSAIRERVERSGERLVVLDDDPTGTQTVHNVTVLTAWEVELLTSALAREHVIFVLTNSRSLPQTEAVALATTLGENLRRAAARAVVDLRVASRSDSTLRGHFPAEVDALARALGFDCDGYVLAPALPEAGRYTWSDVHWVERGGELVPVAETEYARDPTFGYRSSFLPAWVEEKSAGRLHAEDVVRLSLEDIRTGGPERVRDIAARVGGGRVVVVNAVSYRDLEVAAAGIQEAEARGGKFVYRCAAGFVRARAGIRARPFLTAAELRADRGSGGLVVCGSHVPLSTSQLEAARALPFLDAIEFPVDVVIDSAARAATTVAETAARATRSLRAGRVALVFTARQLLRREGVNQLELGRRISDALVQVVRGLEVRPAFVVGKGGITASDLATKALEIREARVLGQVRPAVPVWRTDDGPFAGVPFVVFPGNVGDRSTLAEVIATCAKG